MCRAIGEICDYAEDVGEEGRENGQAVGKEETSRFVGVDVEGRGAENSRVDFRPANCQ